MGRNIALAAGGNPYIADKQVGRKVTEP